MAVRRIKKYPLKTLNGVNEISVPVGSHIIGVAAFNNLPDPVHAFVAEEVKAVGYIVEDPEVKKVLVTTDDGPFNDPGEDQALQYIGTVLWDNGYRVNHVFEIETLPNFDEVGLTEGLDPELLQALNKLGSSPEDIIVETEPVEIQLSEEESEEEDKEEA
jgi:hypothetical protein